MRAPVKAAIFAIALIAVFLAAAALGRGIGPGVAAAPAAGDPAGAGHGDSHSPGPTGAAPVQQLPGGLQVAEDGYRLVLSDTRRPPSRRGQLSFQILGADGRPLTAYRRAHGKDLHLIAVRRDLTGYQHLHPELSAGGTWRAAVDLSAPGAYRIYADFQPAGRDKGLTLGADMLVSGGYAPAALPADSRRAQTEDYIVDLAGDLVAGTGSELTLTVSRKGAPATDLDPYLEAYGHLVALRDGDLAYLHVHPTGSVGKTPAGPEVQFIAEVPSAGRYRLFLDFSHGGVVRTAAFTVTARADGTPASAEPTQSAGPTSPPPAEQTGHEGGGHHG